MTETRGAASPSVPTARGTDYPQVTRSDDETTGWVGWIIFGSMMLFMVGSFQIIAGLVAVFDDEYYAVTNNNLVVHADYTVWGITHMCLGALAIFAGYGLMVGHMWARVYAIILALVSAVVNLGFVDANPVWSTIMITLDVLVIYAVAVHGKELKGQNEF